MTDDLFGIHMNEFPALVEAFLGKWPQTKTLECQAESLIRAGFPHDDTLAFVKEVCKWGGYAGIAGRVLKTNSSEVISTQLKKATEILTSECPNAEMALCEVNLIQTLRKPSFASKHLRFLSPRLCPVLDSIITDELGYAQNPRGYSRFSKHCTDVGSILEASRLSNPTERAAGRWFAADVEMALYAYLTLSDS